MQIQLKRPLIQQKLQKRAYRPLKIIKIYFQGDRVKNTRNLKKILSILRTTI